MQPIANNKIQKIVVLSFQRNATQSTYQFLFESGLFLGVHHLTNIKNSGSFRGWDLKKIQDYAKKHENDFIHFSDAPFFTMYEYFDKKYPKAKFILIERNPHDWLKSFRKLYRAIPIDPISRACFTKYIPVMAEILDTEIDKLEDKTLLDMYNTHNLEVKEYFKDKKNLLVLDIGDQQKANRLVEFLSLERRAEFQSHDYVMGKS